MPYAYIYIYIYIYDVASISRRQRVGRCEAWGIERSLGQTLEGTKVFPRNGGRE